METTHHYADVKVPFWRTESETDSSVEEALPAPSGFAAEEGISLLAPQFSPWLVLRAMLNTKWTESDNMVLLKVVSLHIAISNFTGEVLEDYEIRLEAELCEKEEKAAPEVTILSKIPF